MRLAVLDRRASLVVGCTYLDIAIASGGRFGPSTSGIYADWIAFRQWADTLSPDNSWQRIAADVQFGPPSTEPRQVFGIGLNYFDHVAETGLTSVSQPAVFTKFSSCIVGMTDLLVIGQDSVDWEIELVVIIGQVSRSISSDQAWSHVAGLTIGQDVSDRALQNASAMPQVHLGKSRPGFGPIGPWLVTPDEFDDPDDLEIRCELNGETAQHARTSMLMHPVPNLVSYLSSVVTLLPGDLIFTGTPAGTGHGQTPPRYLRPGDELVGSIEGIGSLRTFTIGATP